METRHDGTDTFALVASLNTLETSICVDESDITDKFAGIVPFGDREGKSMLNCSLFRD